MKIVFKALDDDDGYFLGRVDWPFVPRKGERVILDGLVAKKEWNETPIDEEVQADVPRHRVVFEVFEVVYEADLSERSSDADIDVEVWLCLPPEERVWKGAES